MKVHFDIDSWEYDVIKLHNLQEDMPWRRSVPSFAEWYPSWIEMFINHTVVQNFFGRSEAKLRREPVYNAQHAADVAVAVHLF